MPNTRRTYGRRTTEARRYTLDRDRGICAICGHPGADTLGHRLPVATHPELEHDPANWQAEHGARRTLELDGYDCQGNYAKQATTTTPAPSRDW